MNDQSSQPSDHPHHDIAIYRDSEGGYTLDVSVRGESVWLHLNQIAENHPSKKDAMIAMVVNLINLRNWSFENSMENKLSIALYPDSTGVHPWLFTSALTSPAPPTHGRPRSHHRTTGCASPSLHARCGLRRSSPSAMSTMALSEETGFRSSDVQLRSMLPAGCREWVASINSLMAVPVRGGLLAEALGPVVGTIIETHPRASLLFALGDNHLEMIRRYKKGAESAAMVGELWRLWCACYSISGCDPVGHDGALDALNCATVAYLFHHDSALLLRLRHDAADRTGRGPFYVVAPE